MNFKVYRHVLSQYPALWPCLIYEAASFIFSPVVYQPHETSTRTSFLTTYTEMCTLALSYTHSLQTTACYHYNTGMFDEQYCQQAWKKGNKRVGDWDIVGGSLSTNTHKQRSHAPGEAQCILHSFLSSILFRVQKKRTSKINVVCLIAISIGTEGAAGALIAPLRL